MNPSTSTPPPPRPVLPEVSPDFVGGRLVSRAVTITLGIFAMLLAGATLAAVTIRLKVSVDASGVLQPAEIWSVRSEETGVVRDVLVRMGDTVKAGQPLARLDELKLASDLEQLRARRRALELDSRLARTSVPLEARSVEERRAEAEAELVRARAALRQRLVEHGFEPDIERVRQTYRMGTHIAIDEAMANLLVAEGATRTARIEAERLGLKSIEQSRQAEQLAEIDLQIATMEQRLARLTLHAPADGVVLTDGLERLPGRVLQEGESIMEIAEDRDWRAALVVAERDVSRIRVGDEVQIELRAFGRSNAPTLRGEVLTVGAEPSTTSSAALGRMFPVMVRMNPEDLEAVGLERLRRGYTAQGKIITRSETLIRLIWEYMLRKTEGRREEPPRPEVDNPQAEPKT